MELLVSILKGNDLFSKFTEEELALMVQHCDKLTLTKGGHIFEEGQKDDGAVYFIQEGIIKIVKGKDTGHKVLAMFGVGNIFGEMSFLDSDPRSATASVDEDVVLFKMTPEHFSEFANASPKAATKLFKVLVAKLVKRLRQTDEALMSKLSKIIIT